MSEEESRGKTSSDVQGSDGTKLESRTVRVQLYIPEDMPIHYADSFNLFFSDYDFTLSFFQTQSPLINSDDEWAHVEAVKAKCVSRLVMPPHLIPRIMNILSENWQRFYEARQAQLRERENVSKSTAGDTPPEGGV